MPQRDESCDALQQIKAHGKDGQDHHAGDHLQIIVGTDKGEGRQR